VRGYQKKVIFLKDTGSQFFDEAYFVVSRKGEAAHIEQSDMVFEANRIIKESLEDKELRVRREDKRHFESFIIPFFLGALITLSVTLLVYFLFF
jgi:hypothetical protein